MPGGRAGLSRIASVISPILLGFNVPDYAAYEPLLAVFRNLIPIPSQLSEKDHYKMPIEDLRRSILAQGLTAVLLSNPRNPTGQIIEGDELKALVSLSKELDTTTILDEFYSWCVASDATCSWRNTRWLLTHALITTHAGTSMRVTRGVLCRQPSTSTTSTTRPSSLSTV